MNWEDWLKTAAKRPSNHEDSRRQRTENEIKAALSNYRPLAGRKYRVYAKGSYANNTNVRLNYDVDIAVEYYGYFYSELAFDLKGKDKSAVNVKSSSDSYTRAEFKADILGALEKAYGESAVDAGRIAYRVREKKTTLPADVVPCWEYRRYDRIENGEPVFHQGSRVYPSDGGHKDNFPAQQLAEGIEKNNATGRRYKRMVRALKKLQTRLVENNELDEELPSYLTECLVYNVPNKYFNHATYLADMREVLATIFNATLVKGDWNDWEEVHELKYLFRGKVSWTREQVHTMASAAWDHLGLK
ncbi:nucleotidyltransferase [Amycolatopsis sp. NPDC005961]|uniref:nucleotidyltransferase domain-containing protein n=1 Tax=Amycolatopsis sp. NPDC005961 TaxID=3156720 RepID=UPI0033CBDEBF